MQRISSVFQGWYDNGVAVCTNTYFGLSTEADPSYPDDGTGSAVVLMDTSAVKFFERTSGTWYTWGAEATSAASTLGLSMSAMPRTQGLTMTSPDVVQDRIDDDIAEPENTEEMRQETPETVEEQIDDAR